MYEMIKQCYDWGVYTAEYVKSYFVDEYQSITQEQYEQIVAAKQQSLFILLNGGVTLHVLKRLTFGKFQKKTISQLINPLTGFIHKCN